MATSVWKGHLTFGLVSIPVRLFKAARPEKISFHQLRKSAPPAPPTPVQVKPGPVRVPSKEAMEATPAPAPGAAAEASETYTRVRQQLVAPAPARDEPAAPVARKDIVKGYEYEKNRYVVIEDEELKQLVPKTGTEMQILEFVRLPEIDPVFFETSYYMVPEDAGEKPYALLFASMRETEFVALAEVAMYRREHVMAIRAGEHGLIAHTMFYADEIRADQEYRTDIKLVNAREMDLAKQLVTSLAAAFEPAKYKDKFREKLQSMIDARIAGSTVAETPAPSQVAPVADIMEALQNSLKMLKKPAASEPAPVAQEKRAKPRRAARG